MAASLLPKDLPAEAQGAAAQPSLPHHHHTSHPSHAHSHSHPTHSHTPHSHSHSSSSHTHSNPHHPLIHDPPSDDASNDSASEDDTPPSHPHAHPHSSSGSDEDGPAFDISQTPFAGLYTHLTSSIPLVTAVLLRLLVFTNVVASLLGLFHVLSPPSDSGCSVSMLDASSSPSYPRLFLSLFFDSTYPSAFTTTFAAYELGSRLETQLGSTFFLLLLSTFAAATTAAYYALLTAVPALRLYPCSCGAWPVIFPLLIVETWWNRKLPRSFPLFPYPLPSPAYPLLLTLLQQLTFGIHPYPLVALGVGYVVAVPAVLASLGVALTVERAVTGRWWAGYRRFVSREKAGTMLPWAPLVINPGDVQSSESGSSPEPESSVLHLSPPHTADDPLQPRVERRSPRKLVRSSSSSSARHADEDAEEEREAANELDTVTSPDTDNREKQTLLHSDG